MRASPEATVHGGATTVETGRRLGLPTERLRAVGDHGAIEVGPFSVEAVPARHGIVPLASLVDRIHLPREGVPRTPFRWPRGEVYAWRVTVGGRGVFVQGSAGIDEAALSRQAPVDVLIACIAARKGTPRYLERLGDRLSPRVLVPCHHDDFFRPLTEAPRPVPTLRWRAFREEAAALERAHGTRTWLPARGVAVAV
jgi:L-ascorbate metabolism protein UlaG (beta-lactamase superfamily)